MSASMSTVSGVTMEKSSPSFFFGRGVEPSDGAAAASGSSAGILQFKDNLGNLALSQISGLEEDGETPFFTQVTLPRGINTRAGRAATFDVECSFVAPEEEEEE